MNDARGYKALDPHLISAFMEANSKKEIHEIKRIDRNEVR